MPEREPPSISHTDMYHPIEKDFWLFWSDNGYTLCPFWSGIEYEVRLNVTTECMNVVIVSVPNE